MHHVKYIRTQFDHILVLYGRRNQKRTLRLKPMQQFYRTFPNLNGFGIVAHMTAGLGC